MILSVAFFPKLKHFLRGSEKDGLSRPSVLPLNETGGGGVDLPSNCDKHSRGGAECRPAPFSLWWLKPTTHCTCGLYGHESFPRQNEEFTAAWKDSPAVHGWHGLLCRCRCFWLAFEGGSLSVMMKWKKFQRSAHSHAEGDWRLPPKNSAWYAFNSAPHRRQAARFYYVCC